VACRASGAVVAGVIALALTSGPAEAWRWRWRCSLASTGIMRLLSPYWALPTTPARGGGAAAAAGFGVGNLDCQLRRISPGPYVIGF